MRNFLSFNLELLNYYGKKLLSAETVTNLELVYFMQQQIIVFNHHHLSWLLIIKLFLFVSWTAYWNKWKLPCAAEFRAFGNNRLLLTQYVTLCFVIGAEWYKSWQTIRCLYLSHLWLCPTHLSCIQDNNFFKKLVYIEFAWPVANFFASSLIC